MAGVCWSCQIMPIKVLDAEGNGYDSDIAKGIVWAVQHGAKVINLSLGGPDTSKVLNDAVAYATMNSVLVVAAAGNEGDSVPQYPAALGDVLAVARRAPGRPRSQTIRRATPPPVAGWTSPRPAT
jgi:subtilisin family serine protease